MPITISVSEHKVCVFCDIRAEFVAFDNGKITQYCPQCEGYKGLMTVEEWEDYTGEEWEDG